MFQIEFDNQPDRVVGIDLGTTNSLVAWMNLTKPEVIAGADGDYTFTALLDGDYNVIAVPLEQAREWLDPSFLAAAAPHAMHVSLAAASRTQDLRLTEVVLR